MWRKRLGWLLCRSAGDWPLLCLLAMTLVSLLVSPLPGQSLRAALPLIGGFIAYWLMARWPTTAARLHWSWWGLILVGMFLSLLAPPGMLPPKHVLFRWIPFLKQLGGYLPDTFNQNVIAGTLVVLLPFAVARALLGWPPTGSPCTRGGSWPRGSRRSWAAWGASLLASLAMMLVLTLADSRGAYLATAVSLLLLAGLSWPKARPALVLLVVTTVIVAVARLGWQGIGDVLLPGNASSTFKVRVAIWSRALRLIRDFPLTGVGIGCFQSIMTRLYPLTLRPKGPQIPISHAHNLYLQVAVDLGLPGLVTYLAILGIAAQQAIGAYRRLIFQGERHLGLLSAACLSSLVGMFAHGFLDSAVWGNKGAFIPWVMLGLCAAIWGVSRERVGPSSG